MRLGPRGVTTHLYRIKMCNHLLMLSKQWVDIEVVKEQEAVPRDGGHLNFMVGAAKLGGVDFNA